jgi:ornithine cyclodeaminase/alanine dehydrogenase-like protein (mu-crystallin family)
MRVLTEDEVRALTDRDDAARAVEAADRQFGRTPEIQSRPPVLFVSGPRPALGKAQFGQFVVKGATAPQEGAAGVLLYSRDHPYVLLWDLQTSAPIGMVACDWLSVYRVGVTALVAARRLAPPTVERIAVFGGGRYASEACRLLAGEWPEAETIVVTRSLETAAAFAATMPGNVRAGASHEAAVRGADIVLTMTSAGSPFVHGGWLKSGVLILSMGGDHELDVDVLHACDGLIVDDLDYCLNQGDLGAWQRAGDLPPQTLKKYLRGSIGEVLEGIAPGRTDAAERLLVVLQGLTACDIAVAKTVLDRAAQRGIGQTVMLPAATSRR